MGMRWIQFSKYIKKDDTRSTFEQLLSIFKEMLLHTSGDVSEALAWLTELFNEYDINTKDYSISDFLQDLKDHGYIGMDGGDLIYQPTNKLEIALRQKALEEVFDQLQKSKFGDHRTKYTGKGREETNSTRGYRFGDSLHALDMTETIRNAHINHGIADFNLTWDDLAVRDTHYQSQASTVLMIDISHSMILYGEDRITPAKKVAMALAELITTRYPKDTLDIIVFGNDAWKIDIKDLPYLKVGPYHTNTVAGLELAIDILRRRRNENKQIMMITDGKPTCIKKGKKYYKNPYGLDKTILNRTLSLAAKCRKLSIPITTFMIAQDSYLVEFVDRFTQVNGGKAFYSSLEGLGEFIFMDYKDNKRKSR